MKKYKLQFRFSFLVIFSFLGFVSMNQGFSQTEVKITPDKDNTLIEKSDGSLSNGMGAFFHSGRTGQAAEGTRRAVIHFAVSDSLPVDAMIDSIALILNLENASGTGADASLSLHRLLKDWGEGTSVAPMGGSQGTAATTDDATWLYTFYDTAQWDAAGGDFVSAASAVTVVGSAQTGYVWSGTGLVADVNFWLANPDSNFGWILIGKEDVSGTAKKFYSKDSEEIGQHPKLSITYTTSSSIDKGLTDVSFSAFPNPASEAITLEWKSQRLINPALILIDGLGREVWEKSSSGLFNQGNETIFISHLPAGMYYLSLSTEDGKITRSIVIE
ncbi:MAG: T9SS type A sorting domain-containing protein [Bacteroidetes bacterium]|nr:T9SS type A sorting domain-containing protein [Bacteroidota bacterium]